jgi:transposase
MIAPRSDPPSPSPVSNGARVRVDGRTLPRGANRLIRKLAVQRVARGESPRRVMEGLGLCRTSIYRWLRTARMQGIEALEARRHPGPAPLVSETQAAHLRALIVGHVPADHGLSGPMWTRTGVRELIRRRLSVDPSLPAVGRMLRRAGLHPTVGRIPAEQLPRRETRGLLFAVDGRGAFLCAPFAGRGRGMSLAEASDFLTARVDRRVDLVAVRAPAEGL